MRQPEFFKLITGVLTELEIEHFVTGSVASMYYGESRMTRDIDVVVRLRYGDIPDLLARFPGPDFYLSEEAVRGAMREGGQFNILCVADALKADIMISEESEFDESRFRRRQLVKIDDGLSMSIAAPEDVILKKMTYFHAGGSDKHLRDIAGMLKFTPTIDRDYVNSWAGRLGVSDVWNAVLARIGE